MLNKISNITLQNTDPKGSLSWVKNIRGNPGMHESASDSASFSPAMELLKILEWDNYKMEYPAKNKLSLSFTIEGLEFHTSLNVDTLDTISIINYEVYERGLTGESAVYFRVRFNRLGYTELLVKRKLQGLHELFNNIMLYENDFTEEVLNDSSSLNRLVSGIAHNINSDFSFINNSLIYFLNKLLKVNFNNIKVVNPNEENFFVLLKVKMRAREK